MDNQPDFPSDYANLVAAMNDTNAGTLLSERGQGSILHKVFVQNVGGRPLTEANTQKQYRRNR